MVHYIAASGLAWVDDGIAGWCMGVVWTTGVVWEVVDINSKTSRWCGGVAADVGLCCAAPGDGG